MKQTDIDLTLIEAKMRDAARLYLENVHRTRMRSHNVSSILMRLTGNTFDEISSLPRLDRAKLLIKRALLRERQKARVRHCSYDLNRHIALHQAKLSLDALAITDN